MVCLSGCANDEEKSEAQDLTLEEGMVIASNVYGDLVKIKKNPEYIAPIFAPSAHILSILGENEKIVAISQGNTRDYLFCKIYPHISKTKVVKSNSVSINVEEIMKAPVPNLIIDNIEAEMDKNTLDYFKKNNISVLTIGFPTVESLNEVVTTLGEVLSQEDRAAVYVDYSNKMIDLVGSRTQNISQNEKKKVYHAINELLRTDNEGSLSADLMKKAGVINVGLEINTEAGGVGSKNYIALEELLQANPDYILVNGGDVYDYIQSSNRLHGLSAYQNGNIFLMPLGVTRWGHPNSVETPLALLWTAKTVYPELFEDIDMVKEMQWFYKTMFDYELTQEEINNILSGRVYKEIKGTSETKG